ncbi:MAG TPA: hypothetical protein VG165_15510 [Solirubrobacteraceae bacterium]|nr:hypothetical protein [Solirubrobacteraceae bacterium]
MNLLLVDKSAYVRGRGFGDADDVDRHFETLARVLAFTSRRAAPRRLILGAISVRVGVSHLPVCRR